MLFFLLRTLFQQLGPLIMETKDHITMCNTLDYCCE